MRTNNNVRPWMAQRIYAVKAAVAEEFGVSVYDIDREDRHMPLPTIRHAAMRICRELLKATYPEISLTFYRKNHGAAMYACRSTVDRISVSPKFREQYERATESARSNLRTLQTAAA